MTSRHPVSGLLEQESESTLSMLDAIGSGRKVTQRGLAADLGIALGLTNVYLKRCIKKGLVKMRKAPARRYAYYLTAKGFAEKTRLTAKFLSKSFDFFRSARQDCDEVFAECERRGLRRVALIGASDLAEIAVLAALNSEVEVVAVVDGETNHTRLAGVAVARDLDALAAVDAVIVTNIKQPQAIYDDLVTELDPARVLTPGLLRVTRRADAEVLEAAQ